MKYTINGEWRDRLMNEDPASDRWSAQDRVAVEARQKAIRARVAKKERARDTRRKILVGAFVLHRIESDTKHGPGLRKWLQEGLPGFLREIDRELFPDIIGDAEEKEGSLDSREP